MSAYSIGGSPKLTPTISSTLIPAEPVIIEDKPIVQPLLGEHDTFETGFEGQTLTFFRSTSTYITDPGADVELKVIYTPDNSTFPSNRTISEASSKFTWGIDYCDVKNQQSQQYRAELEYWDYDWDPYTYITSESIIITVKNINPVIQNWNQPSSKYIAVGTPWHIDLQATDEDAICDSRPQYATWSWTYNPTLIGANFENSSTIGIATFDWTPTAAEIGTHTLTFTAKDNFQNTQQKQVFVTVYQPRPPCTPYYNKNTHTWVYCPHS
ncbi:MAG: hypothetical protein V1835_01775 [Candidatus Micrarchaeota archaeon]